METKKCCGTCTHLKYEDASGRGWCNHYVIKENCSAPPCMAYEPKNNGWTELTPDNVDELNADLIAVTDGTDYKMANYWHISLSTMAKLGGYYFIKLPELKLDNQ